MTVPSDFIPPVPQKFLFDLPLDPLKVEEELIISSAQPFSEGTLKDVDLARQQAFEEGIAKGREEFRENCDLQKEALLRQLNAYFHKLVEQHNSFYTTLHVHLGGLVMEMIKKIFPVLEKKFGLPEIEHRIQDILEAQHTQDRLIVYVHSDHISFLQEHLSGANQASSKPAILCKAENTLGLSDCRLEWDEGGIERRVSSILTQISEVIEQSYCIQDDPISEMTLKPTHTLFQGDHS